MSSTINTPPGCKSRGCVRDGDRGIGQVREHEPDGDHVVGTEVVLGGRRHDVGHLVLDIGEPGRARLAAREVQLGVIEIRAEHAPLGGPRGEGHGHVTAAAAGVQTAGVGGDPDPVEQGVGRRDEQRASARSRSRPSDPPRIT
jgi:hypothetical protein